MADVIVTIARGMLEPRKARLSAVLVQRAGNRALTEVLVPIVALGQRDKVAVNEAHAQNEDHVRKGKVAIADPARKGSPEIVAHVRKDKVVVVGTVAVAVGVAVTDPVEEKVLPNRLRREPHDPVRPFGGRVLHQLFGAARVPIGRTGAGRGLGPFLQTGLLVRCHRYRGQTRCLH